MSSTERFGPTRRGGPLFRWLGEPLAIDLANTVMVVPAGEQAGADDGGQAVDLLATPEDLRRWLRAEGERLAWFEIDADADLRQVRELREAVRSLLGTAAGGHKAQAGALAAINAASAAAPVAPQLAAGPDGSTRIESAPGGGGARELLGAVARSAIELVATTPEGGLRVCHAPSCGMYYLGARRWCCSACGNRARAARHYRRHRRAAGPRPHAAAGGGLRPPV
jgi:predicted RNA-binding Zn ribbon-like protein